jgi:hypothetical protein
VAHYTLLVLTNPVSGREDEYNNWYDNQHLSDLLAVDGFVAAQRFRLAETDPPQQFAHRYLAIYEIETDDLAKTQAALAAAANTDAMIISDALDLSDPTTMFFSRITDRVVAS